MKHILYHVHTDSWLVSMHSNKLQLETIVLSMFTGYKVLCMHKVHVRKVLQLLDSGIYCTARTCIASKLQTRELALQW